jgi:exodeoxyribonuclease VII small subunit
MVESKKKQTINTALAELEKIVAYFESKDFELEVGVDKYAEAAALVKKIATQLTSVELKIREHRAAIEAILTESDS